MTSLSPFIAVNWGSTNFRAYLIDQTGSVIDQKEMPAGILKLDRPGMVDTLESATSEWDSTLPVYLNGMITSNVGWENVPYVQAPCSTKDFCMSILQIKIGSKQCGLVPGISCRDEHNNPDIMRGEEIEIFGALRLSPELCSGEHTLILPGTHTKWVKLKDGKVVGFFTSMVGEIFDHLSSNGLLSSVIDGYGRDDKEFERGIAQGSLAGTGFGRTLFGVRAQFVCGDLAKEEAASYARGIMLGAEIHDGLEAYPSIKDQQKALIVGPSDLSALYKTALEGFGVKADILPAKDVTIAGYTQLHELIAEALV